MWGWPFSTWEWVVKASLVIAVLTGVATAFFAFVAGYVGYELADAVGKVSDQKVADARGVADTARADAAKSNLDVAKANERIAELGKESAQLSANAEASKAEIAKANARAAEAQLALERFKAPREIPIYKIPEIDKAVAPFAGTKIDVMVLAEGPEPTALGAQIGSVLFAKPAGWTGRVFPWTGGGTATGVLVSPKPGSDARVLHSASALVGALTDAGVAATVFEWPGDWTQFGGFTSGSTAPDAVMRVVIGSKPQ